MRCHAIRNVILQVWKPIFSASGREGHLTLKWTVHPLFPTPAGPGSLTSHFQNHGDQAKNSLARSEPLFPFRTLEFLSNLNPKLRRLDYLGRKHVDWSQAKGDNSGSTSSKSCSETARARRCLAERRPRYFARRFRQSTQKSHHTLPPQRPRPRPQVEMSPFSRSRKRGHLYLALQGDISKWR